MNDSKQASYSVCINCVTFIKSTAHTVSVWRHTPGERGLYWASAAVELINILTYFKLRVVFIPDSFIRATVTNIRPHRCSLKPLQLLFPLQVLYWLWCLMKLLYFFTSCWLSWFCLLIEFSAEYQDSKAFIYWIWIQNDWLGLIQTDWFFSGTYSWFKTIWAICQFSLCWEQK